MTGQKLNTFSALSLSRDFSSNRFVLFSAKWLNRGVAVPTLRSGNMGAATTSAVTYGKSPAKSQQDQENPLSPDHPIGNSGWEFRELYENLNLSGDDGGKLSG